MKWNIDHLEEIKTVAKQFLDYVGERKIFALYGAMGVGKTTFVKAIAECLEIEDDVSSPTFAIVNEYVTKKGDAIYHFDFYRVNNISEALDFGYEEYFYSGCKCFIEWPDKIKELLPENVVNCCFKEKADGSRELEVMI